MSKKVQPSLLSPSEEKLKTNGNITLHNRKGDLLISVLVTVVKELSIDVLLDSALIFEHIVAVLADECTVNIWK